MAPSHSFLFILSLVWSLTLIPFVFASPWIVTEDYEQVRVTNYPYDDYYYETELGDPTITTSIEQIIPTVTPLPEALSTITSIDDYSTVTIIQKLYPTSVGTPVPYDYGYYDYYDTDDHTTVYVVNITYTAPTACSTDWTLTTAATVYPPSEVRDGLPTTAMSTSISVDNSEPFQPTTYTYDYVYVDPTQIPSSSMSYLSEDYYPMTMYDTCGYSSSSSDGDSDSDGYTCPYAYCGSRDYYHESDNWWFDSYYMGISPFALVMILTFGWIGLFLILGFIEAWVRFRRLMLGWQTRRGLPILWAFTILPLTILVIIGWRKGFQARSAADAAVLRQQWKEMGFWTKIKLFFLWGFRYKYPPILGEAPPRVKPSKRPSKQPGSQPQDALLNTNPPPMASGAVGQAPQMERAVGADPEMGEVESTPRPSSGPSSSGPSAQEQPATTEGSGALSGHHDGEIGRAQ